MASLITNTERNRIWLHDNRFASGEYTATDAVTLKAGTLLGRITATGKLVPHTKGASDGSAVPLGILAEDYTVAASATVRVKYCDAGEVDETLVLLDGTDTLNTAITGVGIIRDVIQRNTLIKLVAVQSLTKFDNQ